MKNLIIVFISLLFLSNNSYSSEKIDCTVFKKLSKEHLGCKAKNIGSGIKNIGKGVKKEKKIRLVPKSVSKKKYISDWFKKKE